MSSPLPPKSKLCRELNRFSTYFIFSAGQMGFQTKGLRFALTPRIRAFGNSSLSQACKTNELLFYSDNSCTQTIGIKQENTQRAQKKKDTGVSVQSYQSPRGGGGGGAQGAWLSQQLVSKTTVITSCKGINANGRNTQSRCLTELPAIGLEEYQKEV